MAGNFVEGSKAQVRQVLETRRRALAAEEVRAKGGEAQRCLAALSSFQAARLVALYSADPFEVPTALLWEGRQVCLPRVNPGTKVLSFHRVSSPAQLVQRGKLKLLEPPDGSPAVGLTEIDLWVIPGVGFTRTGDRLGRGGGYYDATLIHARTSCVKVGLGFECCLVEQLPTQPHDIRMDEIVTELGTRLATASQP